jgi:4'-phosphopantetheinyl transferase
LNDEEKIRAQRFRVEKDRLLFVAGRSVLRHILATYLELEPYQIELSKTPEGRPYLHESQNALGFDFNISHSGEKLCIAVSQDGRVGVDLEYLDGERVDELISSQVFAVDELDYLNALTGKEKVSAFYSLWVRKEACLKACGIGLGIEPSTFSVLWTLAETELGEDHPVQIRGKEWFLRNLPPFSQYRSAYASDLEEPLIRVHQWEWL